MEKKAISNALIQRAVDAAEESSRFHAYKASKLVNKAKEIKDSKGVANLFKNKNKKANEVLGVASGHEGMSESKKLQADRFRAELERRKSGNKVVNNTSNVVNNTPKVEVPEDTKSTEGIKKILKSPYTAGAVGVGVGALGTTLLSNRSEKTASITSKVLVALENIFSKQASYEIGQIQEYFKTAGNLATEKAIEFMTKNKASVEGAASKYGLGVNKLKHTIKGREEASLINEVYNPVIQKSKKDIKILSDKAISEYGGGDLTHSSANDVRDAVKEHMSLVRDRVTELNALGPGSRQPKKVKGQKGLDVVLTKEQRNAKVNAIVNRVFNPTPRELEKAKSKERGAEIVNKIKEKMNNENKEFFNSIDATVNKRKSKFKEPKSTSSGIGEVKVETIDNSSIVNKKVENKNTNSNFVNNSNSNNNNNPVDNTRAMRLSQIKNELKDIHNQKMLAMGAGGAIGVGLGYQALHSKDN